MKLDEQVYTKVYTLLKNIPDGKVITYGQIAKICDLSSPRQVGYILHQNQNPDLFPCYKVVNFRGCLAKNYAFGGIRQQQARLEQEGIKVNNYCLDLKAYLWQIDPKEVRIQL